MKKSFSLFGTVVVMCGMALPMLPGQLFAAASEIDNGAGRLPVDLARGSLGATLQVRAAKNAAESNPLKGAKDSAQGLISDDASLSYPLDQGSTSMILSLRKTDVLSRLNFINYGAQGKITISASATKLPFDSKDWHPVASRQEFGGDKVVGCDLGSLEARYLKIDFDTQTAGRISGLGVFGLLTINTLDPQPASNYTVTANPGAQTAAGSMGGDVFYDMANLNTGAKVVQVSRGGSVNRAQALLDGNVETNYSFDPTDPSPTVVVDLSARRAINRLSCVYQAPPGRIDFYLVDNPYTKDYERSATIGYISDPSTRPADAGASSVSRTKLAEHKAIASINTSAQPGINHASADVGGASGRFLIAEFHPIAGPAPKADAKDFKDAPDYKDFKDAPVAAEDAGQPLRLISLSAFGDSFAGDTISRVPNVPNTPPGTVPGTAQPPVLPPNQGTIVRITP